jgi:hypothetical protein
MDDAMAAAHARDYGQKARIDTLRTVIRDFLDDSPSRVRLRTLSLLSDALHELDEASAHIVRVWD